MPTRQVALYVSESNRWFVRLVIVSPLRYLTQRMVTHPCQPPPFAIFADEVCGHTLPALVVVNSHQNPPCVGLMDGKSLFFSICFSLDPTMTQCAVLAASIADLQLLHSPVTGSLMAQQQRAPSKAPP